MSKDLERINKKYLFFIILIYLLVFQNFLQKYVPIMQYFDEIVALLCIPCCIVRIFKKGFIIKKYTFIIIICLVTIFIVGMFSIIKYKYQSVIIALSDVLLVYKFFMIYFLSSMLWDEEFIDKNKSKILFHIKFIIYFLFICTFFNYTIKIWPTNDYRFGIMSNKLFFEHQTALAAICIFLLSLLSLSGIKKCKIETVILIFILLSTLRFKAIGAGVIIFIMVFYVNKTEKKLTLSKFFILAIIALILAYDQINYYFIELSGSARNQLLLKSIEIMKDYFPIGTGFGTYASHFSAVSYSPVYYLYGLSNVYGLSKGNTFFLSDSFWPMIFGQFGIIGTICYIICIFIIFRNIQSGFKKDNFQLYISKLICYIYILISSTSESAFVNPIIIPLALIIGIENKRNNRLKENEK